MAEEYATFRRTHEETVYRQYAPQIFTYLLRHVSSPQDAEDLLLEVFLPVLAKLQTLESNASGRVWLITTMLQASKQSRSLSRKRNDKV